MAYRHYKSYSAHIQKADHVDKDGKHDLHVHLFYNEGKSRKLLGRYRIPTLEPIFSHRERELTLREVEFLRDWLAEPQQVKKLEGFLRETLFDMHKLGRLAHKYSEILTDKDGETYVCIRVPVSKRIQ